MKLTFIGAGGVRTPLVIESVMGFQDRIPIDTLCLMDVDQDRLDLIRMVSEVRLENNPPKFDIEWTVNPKIAITESDFVVMTLRSGGMASRVIDEQIPLKYEVLGQETTGPGGFSMAMRTIPVILQYIELIEELSPEAWLINFSNPAGIITEASSRIAGYERVVGICDNPSAMQREIAAHLGVLSDRPFFEYYGLNHLGWMSGVYLEGKNYVPDLISEIVEYGAPWHWLPFHVELIEALGVIPNEYLLFYYYPRKSVENYLKAGQSRAQQILPFVEELYETLSQIRSEKMDSSAIMDAYVHYQNQRDGTYMSIETGEPNPVEEMETEDELLDSAAEGYSGVMLKLVEALTQDKPTNIILNVPNRGAIPDMADEDVVEVNCYVRDGLVRPFTVGPIPDHALGLMKRVKAYERLTIEAAVEGSYSTALKALALHPLVPSYEIGKSILDDYIQGHGKHFPTLQ